MRIGDFWRTAHDDDLLCLAVPRHLHLVKGKEKSAVALDLKSDPEDNKHVQSLAK